MFDEVLDDLRTRLRCHAIAVLLLDGERRLRFAAWRHLSEAYRARVEAYGPIVPDREQPRPIFLQNVDQDEAYRINWDLLRAERIVSMAFYPMVFEGRLVGKLTVYYDFDHVPRPEEVALAEAASIDLARCSTQG